MKSDNEKKDTDTNEQKRRGLSESDKAWLRHKLLSRFKDYMTIHRVH